ncbi:MAG: glutathione S-transferase [Rhodospirillales bacterium 70-18]|mgnify:CR=1 FL=1|nr:glutathione S-transferase N-terminal domain-containing protein [Rhodospirillales bacterium]OJY70558.1 MAG: glutathione S-transferase [Rhodospirillales bacterium 70-18]
MKLFYSPSSPYVRKVMACAIARGIDQQITLVPANPHQSPAGLLAANPLSKVPCLVTVDGLALFDSPVICEFLDSVGDELPMFPRAGGARWRALKQQALGDGIMDAAIARRMEQARPREAARDAVMARQQAAVSRALAELEREVPHRTADIGTLTIACALGYLDFRFAAEPWRPDHPQLAAWFAAMMELPALVRTVPAEPA